MEILMDLAFKIIAALGAIIGIITGLLALLGRLKKPPPPPEAGYVDLRDYLPGGPKGD